MKEFYELGYAEPGLTTELPSDDELAALVESEFRGTDKDFRYNIEVLRALGLKPGDRLLDYGANWGYCTWQYRKAGFDAEGFELSRSRAAFSRKLGLDIATSIANLNPPYDAVYSCHVLEHTPDPRQTISQQLGLLREGGLLVAHTPNGSAGFREGSREFHHNWGQSHPVLLTERFVAGALSSLPYIIASDDRPDKVATWDHASQEIRDCSGSGLFFAARKSG